MTAALETDPWARGRGMWSDEDDFHSRAEGWFLYANNDPAEGGPWLLWRTTAQGSAGLKHTKMSAWLWVTYQANLGSPLHKRALAMLYEESPQEWLRVCRYAALHRDATR